MKKVLSNLNLILAISKDGVIGKKGVNSNTSHSIPWKIQSDMVRFKKLTTGCGVIMGRTTWESIPEKYRPLPDRENIVLSRNTKPIKGAIVMSSVDEVIQYVESNSEKLFWVIGGTEIYAQFFPLVAEIHLTEVNAYFSEKHYVQGPNFPRKRSGVFEGFYFAFEEYFEIAPGDEYSTIYKIFKQKLEDSDIDFLRKRAIKQIAVNRAKSRYLEIKSPYENLLFKILKKGKIKKDRTGTGTVSLFGEQIRFDLSSAFPLITTKKIALKPVIYELLWFLKGDSNIEYLCKNGVSIWDDWPYEVFKKSSDFNNESIKEFAKRITEDSQFAKKWGDLGPVYGVQWRSWQGSNGEVFDQIKKNPDSRRLMVSAWNVADISKMALPPCHAIFQFYVADGKLSCQLYQRSADVFLGVPFNIASYALLTMMIAQVCGLQVGEFIHTFGDVHIYANHFDQIAEQLSRQVQLNPSMYLNESITSIEEFTFSDFSLKGYDPHPAIIGDVAV